MAEKSAKAYAVASFISGIISLLFGWVPLAGWIFITLALVFGLVSLRKIKKSNLTGKISGKNLAIAGLALGGVALIMALSIGVAVFKNLPDNSSVQEKSESGGTLAGWKEKVQQEVGVESEEFKTLIECETLLKQKVNQCSQHQGWSVVNVMEVTDFQADQPYSFQEVSSGGCARTSPTGEEYPQQVETKTIITQAETGSSYQVACNIVCVWWDCTEETDQEDTTLTPETWTGTITAQVEDLEYSCSDGVASVSYTFTLHSPVSLISALNGDQEITLWSDPGYKETSGTISGTAIVDSQPTKQGVIYCEFEDGDSGDVPLTFFATGEQTIQLSEVPGAKTTLRTNQFGKKYIYHEEADLTDESFLAGFPPLLAVTSMTDTQISGMVKPGYGYTGTFMLTKE